MVKLRNSIRKKLVKKKENSGFKKDVETTKYKRDSSSQAVPETKEHEGNKEESFSLA